MAETFAPVTLQRLASSVPWALVALILFYGAQAGEGAQTDVIGYGGAAVMTLVAWRAARMRMLLGDEVVLTGWFAPKKYPWSEVERFVVTDRGLAVKLRGGLEQQVPAFPMGGWMFRSMRDSMRTDLARVAERAERIRRERRSGRR